MHIDNTEEPPSSAQFSIGRDVLRIALIALAYLGALELAFLFPAAATLLATVWPAGGIGLAALLLSPRRLWPAIGAALFAAGVAANLAAGRPAVASLGFMVANVGESLGCAWLIARMCVNGARFERVKEVLALVVAAVFVNAGSALVGAGTAALASGVSFWSFWATWWIANGFGILLVTPLIVTWAAWRAPAHGIHWGRAVEFGAFLIVWCAFAALSFGVIDIHPLLHPQPYALTVLLIWPALRFGQRDMALALLLLAAITITSPAVSAGPLLWGGDSGAERLLQVQAFLAITATTALLLTASQAESRMSEQASREDQARLRALDDNLPHGVVFQVLRERNGAKRFLFVSAGVERVNGISAREALRDSALLFDQIVEEDRAMVDDAEAASAREMREFNVVARIRRPAGDQRWVQLSASPRRLAGGRILWDGIQMDITARKEAEIATRESEERLKQAMHLARLGIWDWDMATDKVSWQGEMFRIYGITPEEFTSIGSDYLHFTRPDYRAEQLENVKKVFEKGVTEAELVAGKGIQPDPKELCIVWPDGTERFIVADAVSIVDANGKPVRMFGITRDITERKRAEEALRDSEASLKFSQLVAHVGHWTWSTAENRVTWSDEICRIFGLDPATLSGDLDKIIERAIHPDDRARVVDSTRAVLIEQRPAPIEYRVVWPDQSVHTVWAEAGETVVDANGRILKLSGIVQDITERKRVEEALRQKIDELERFTNLAVDRELRMIELKKEINALLTRAGEPEKYRIVE